MAGRNSANSVSTSELPARMPGLMADTILACSDSVTQGIGSNLAPFASVSAHTSAQPLTVTDGSASIINAHPGQTNPFDSAMPVATAPSSSPSMSKRVNFGLKLATIGGEKWKGPRNKSDRAPKPPRLTTKAPWAATDGAHGSNVPFTTSTTSISSTHSNPSDGSKLIENSVSHSDKSAANISKPIQINEHTTPMTKPRTAVPATRPVTSVNNKPIRLASREETAPSISTTDNPRDATGLSSASSLPIWPVTPTAPSQKAASSAARCAYSRTDIHLVANPSIIRPPRPPLPVAPGACQPGIPNEPNSKHREKINTSSNLDQPTQKPIASTLKSVPVALTSQSSSAETTSEAASESHRLKFSLVPFARPGGSSGGNRMPLPQPNETSNASPSTSSSGHLITTPKALSAPPHPKVLSGASNKEQWDIDTEYMVVYMNWRYEQDPTLMPIDIIKEIAQDYDAWRGRFASYETNIFVHRVPELGKRFHRKISSVDPKTTNKPQHSTQPRASDVNLRDFRSSYLNDNWNEVDHREPTGEAERDSSSSDSDDELAEGVRRVRKRTRSEKNPEKKRPRYTE
ncbi:hypothetical protein FRC12_018944 [Ceratobasidium sp. 428]|nr:hypothetical protein FRC12_018944 [Ceratobasidium sp. 428]